MVFVLDFIWRAYPRFREDDVVGLWIPAFAGMTGGESGNDGGESENDRGLIEAAARGFARLGGARRSRPPKSAARSRSRWRLAARRPIEWYQIHGAARKSAFGKRRADCGRPSRSSLLTLLSSPPLLVPKISPSRARRCKLVAYGNCRNMFGVRIRQRAGFGRLLRRLPDAAGARQPRQRG